MPTTLFLSPHLDDAVFSCAGLIQRAVAEGHRVIVATVFSEGGPDHASRRAEDARAAALLGAEPLWLGLLDAPYRSPFYSGFESLIFGTTDSDAGLAEELSVRLAGLLHREQPRHIFAPLAVGAHIDHRLTFDAVRHVQGAHGMSVRCYEDRPYAWAAGMAELRLRQLGILSEAVDEQSLLGSFRALPFVRRYLPPGPERARCEGRLLAPLASEADLVPAPPSEVHAFTPAETAAAHTAAQAYTSQFPGFCGTFEELQQWDALCAARLGISAPRIERTWTIPP